MIRAWVFVGFNLAILACKPQTSVIRELPQIASTSEAKPPWADLKDKTDENGTLMVCEGQGKNEAAARQAAYKVCAVKTCELCPYVTEDLFETDTQISQTLTQEVVKRCVDVAEHTPQAMLSATQCSVAECTIWLRATLTTEQLRDICLQYAGERLANSDDCNRTLTSFTQVEGRSAQTLKERKTILTRAIAHCLWINRNQHAVYIPLFDKLTSGLDSVIYKPSRNAQHIYHTHWLRYLAEPKQLQKELATSSDLPSMLKKVRNYVSHKAAILGIVEAVLADEHTTDDGIESIYQSLETILPGTHYETPDIYPWVLGQLTQDRVQETRLTKLVLDRYLPFSTSHTNLRKIVFYLASDAKTTPTEWEYVLKIPKSASKIRLFGMQTLVKQPNQLPSTKHKERFLATLNFAWQLLEKEKVKSESLKTKRYDSFTKALPQNPNLFLDILEELPTDIRRSLKWSDFEKIYTYAEGSYGSQTQEALIRSMYTILLDRKSEDLDRGYCLELPRYINFLRLKLSGMKQTRQTEDEQKLSFENVFSNISAAENQAGPQSVRIENVFDDIDISQTQSPLRSLDQQVCSCLEGPLSDDATRALEEKSLLYNHALTDGLSCVSNL